MGVSRILDKGVKGRSFFRECRLVTVDDSVNAKSPCQNKADFGSKVAPKGVVFVGINGV